MNKLVALIASGSLICSASLFANQTTINWGAQNDNGVGTSTGTALPAGDLVMIGTFNGLTNAQIATASFSTLQADFVQFASAHIGDPVVAGVPQDPNGYWTGVSTASDSSLGIAGKAVYYWVLNASSFGAATQQGVFTGSTNTTPSVAAQWTFPDDSTLPGTLTNDLDQTPPNSTGILIGSFGPGSANGFTLYQLAPISAVPEPSTYASTILGLVGIGATLLRRRPRK